MDSSQSQHSDHSASGSHSRSDNSSDSRSLTRSSSGSEPSDVGVGNNPPEMHPYGDDTESSGSLKTITSTDYEPDDQEDEDVDIMDESTPTPSEEHHETKSPTVQENAEDTATGSRENQRGAEEIGFLSDLYAFYNRMQHYRFIKKDDMQEFYNRQINVYRAYATEADVDKKLNELYDNYIKLMDENTEAPTDPIDIQIFQQSSWIWGDAAELMEDDEDSLHKRVLNDHGITGVNLEGSSKQENDDMKGKRKDSSKQEYDDMKGKRKDSSKQETGDDDDSKDQKGRRVRRKLETGDAEDSSKGLSKQETGGVDMKDSGDFPKETGGDEGGITGVDRKDSSGKEGGPSAS